MRIGFGYDVHKLVAGRKLIIGGVDIPNPKGLEGHSDADVLLHAIADALLGAAAMGDIGKHFPDTELKWKGASSLDLLKRVSEIVVAADYRIINIDATLVLESPKIAPHVLTMRENIARSAGITAGQVSVKATTSEGMGFVGAGEGAAAYAVAAIEERTR